MLFSHLLSLRDLFFISRLRGEAAPRIVWYPLWLESSELVPSNATHTVSEYHQPKALEGAGGSRMWWEEVSFQDLEVDAACPESVQPHPSINGPRGS